MPNPNNCCLKVAFYYKVKLLQQYREKLRKPQQPAQKSGTDNLGVETFLITKLIRS